MRCAFLALGALWTLGCGDVTDPRASLAGAKADTVSEEMLELDVAVTWTIGEGWEVEPLPASVVYDEDEGTYQVATTVKLGPMAECAKQPSERAEGAVCGWDAPSAWWEIELDVRFVEDAAVLGIDIWAGDADTDGGSSLPVDAIPASIPWRISFSPDNAGGSWGDVRIEIKRRLDPEPQPGPAEPTTHTFSCSCTSDEDDCVYGAQAMSLELGPNAAEVVLDVHPQIENGFKHDPSYSPTVWVDYFRYRYDVETTTGSLPDSSFDILVEKVLVDGGKPLQGGGFGGQVVVPGYRQSYYSCVRAETVAVDPAESSASEPE